MALREIGCDGAAPQDPEAAAVREVDNRQRRQHSDEEAAKQDRIRKWESFCRPARTYDSEGVIRLVYAHRGCEFGRSE